jgi:translation elongation factor EF-4
VILTAPGVEYKAEIVENESIRKKRYNSKDIITITSPDQFPEQLTDVARFLEPMVLVTMVVPNEYLAGVNELCSCARGEPHEAVSIDEGRLLVKWRLPLADVVVDFFEDLKRLTRSYRAKLLSRTLMLNSALFQRLCFIRLRRRRL